jgi:predicted DNA-binding transcriptional regulator AlpA
MPRRPRRPLQVLLRSHLPDKGIDYSRQHIDRKIKDGTFPPPDGKTADGPSGHNFWFETTIDNWLKARAKVYRDKRATAAAA